MIAKLHYSPLNDLLGILWTFLNLAVNLYTNSMQIFIYLIAIIFDMIKETNYE